MNLRFIDWIWCIRGNLALAPGQSSDEAFERLRSLFQKQGTTHQTTGETLTFRKKDQAAQDAMSIFEGGILHIENQAGGAVLRYILTSRALLFCFLAPLLFLGFAQLNITLGKLDKQATEAAKKAGKDTDAKKKADAEKKEIKLNPIDKMLGAPEPEKPKKDGKDKKEEKKEDKKFSPTSGYVFAGIFAALWLIGRILEDWLIRRLFRKTLLGEG